MIPCRICINFGGFQRFFPDGDILFEDIDLVSIGLIFRDDIATISCCQDLVVFSGFLKV